MIVSKIDDFFKRPYAALDPFHEEAVNFCCEISKSIFQVPSINQFPNLVALAYWMRPTHVQELKRKFNAYQENANYIMVPRGAVFHIAPANVSTIFVYSWIISLLVGNANIIRLPGTITTDTNLLLEIIDQLLGKHPLIKQTTAMIRYGHEEKITSLISSQCDVRIIWGGDHTIEKIRQSLLKSTAKEIVFPDRFSYTLIDCLAYLELKEAEKEKLALSFYNDAYLFDQMACSSPKALIWLASCVSAITEVRNQFYNHLQKTLEKKGYLLPLGNVLQKETYLYEQALTIDIQEVRKFSNELTMIQVSSLEPPCRKHNGGGLFYDLSIFNLFDIISLVTEKDQTLTTFGIPSEDLKKLASQLKGRGITRMVPIGSALNFDYLWDGYDLLKELTKYVSYNV